MGVNNESELLQINHNFQITNNVQFQATVQSYQISLRHLLLLIEAIKICIKFLKSLKKYLYQQNFLVLTAPEAYLNNARVTQIL